MSKMHGCSNISSPPLFPKQRKSSLVTAVLMKQTATSFVTTKTSASSHLSKLKPAPRPSDLNAPGFSHDPEMRSTFALRKPTVEPFQGRLKSLFELEYLCMKGFRNVRTLVILATLAYLLLAKLNQRLGLDILKLQDTLIAIR